MWLALGSIALIDIGLLRETNFIGLPLEVELITNCVTGQPQLLDSLKLKGFDKISCLKRNRKKSTAQTAFDIAKEKLKKEFNFISLL